MNAFDITAVSETESQIQRNHFYYINLIILAMVYYRHFPLPTEKKIWHQSLWLALIVWSVDNLL